MGSLEETTIATMKVHRKSLESYFGKSTLIESIDLVALQGYIEKRSRDRGLAGLTLAGDDSQGSHDTANGHKLGQAQQAPPARISGEGTQISKGQREAAVHAL